MRVALLSDVHGNLPALEAVLAEVEAAAPDAIVFTGDHAAGPFPRETLDLLFSLGERARFLRGNADREMVEGSTREQPIPAVGWAAARLSAAQREFLAGLPFSESLEVDGLGPTFFCHGSPRTDEEILTAETPEERLREALAAVSERTVTCGHTHMQFDRTLDGVRVLNPGSVGMPYEGRPGAYWALLGPEVEFRRTEYDVERAAALVRATDYPDADGFAEETLLRPRGRDEVTAFFERMALENPRFAGKG